MAFPVAVVCVLLYSKHDEFFDILMGRFIKRCPYIIPCYLNKVGMEKEYLKRLGYREVDDNGTMETEIQYSERMTGIIALYAAICQTTLGTVF